MDIKRDKADARKEIKMLCIIGHLTKFDTDEAEDIRSDCRVG